MSWLKYVAFKDRFSFHYFGYGLLLIGYLNCKNICCGHRLKHHKMTSSWICFITIKSKVVCNFRPKISNICQYLHLARLFTDIHFCYMSLSNHSFLNFNSSPTFKPNALTNLADNMTATLLPHLVTCFSSSQNFFINKCAIYRTLIQANNRMK